MLPEPLTLVSVLTLIMVFAGGNYLVIWLQNRRERALLWLMASAFGCGGGLFLRATLPEPTGITFAIPWLMLGIGCVWAGCRALVDRPPPWAALVGLFLLWPAATLLPGFLTHALPRIVLGFGITALLMLLALRNLLRVRDYRRAGFWLVAVLLGGMAVLCLGWALGQALHIIRFGSDDGRIGHINAAVFAFATAAFQLAMGYAFVALVKERSEHAHASAAALDGLTGLGNRQKLDRAIAAAVVEAYRTGQNLGAIMIDIDHFKAYNDWYGHPAGDACLSMVASCLARCIDRAEEEVMRYGGEEFTVLIRHASAERALALAETMRLAVRELRVPHAGNGHGIVTISLGVAVLPGSETMTGDVITAADRALYRAKQMGRDCTMLCASLDPQDECRPARPAGDG